MYQTSAFRHDYLIAARNLTRDLNRDYTATYQPSQPLRPAHQHCDGLK
jgi:hypothetical protein